MAGKNKYNKFLRSSDGAAVIEYAILLPVFIILSLAVIEFGMYFVKDEIANSAVSNVSQTIQRDPAYYASLTPAQLQTVVKSYGSGLVDFTKAGTYLCVDAYKSPTQAAGAAACTSTHFNTSNPNGANSTIPYYISVRADLPKGTITPLGNFVPGVKNIQVNQSSGAVQVGNLIPPKCNQGGQVLQFDATTNTYTCVYSSFIIKSGTVNMSTASGAYWITDYTEPPVPHNNWTTCRTVNFTIPSGLPTSGHIIPSGNVINGGKWHGWAVTFMHVNAPISGGNGSMDACMSDSGGYNTLPNGIFSEDIVWKLEYSPN